MRPVRNSMRFLRRNAVLIVIALLIALVYSQRKSFKKTMGGGGAVIDKKACEGLCGDVVGAVPAGGYKLGDGGAFVEDSTGTRIEKGGEGYTELLAKACGDSAAAAPAPKSRRRRR